MSKKVKEEKRISDLKRFIKSLGINIEKIEALNTALIHPTFVFENKGLGLEHNQRLEFLGDAVLGLIAGEFLYHNYPQKPEGELTRLRAAVVCETTLAKVAKKLHLGEQLLLGRGEELTGGRERPSILADALEAVIAAIYLETGLSGAKKFIIEQLADEITEVVNSGFKDYKTMLQEIVQKEHDDNVTYAILEESGPDHDKSFVAGVIWKNNLLAKGEGKSKKEAEQQAASKAIHLFKGQV
jgi:ribonuclease-3